MVAAVGPAAFERLGQYFVKAGVPYPTSEVTLLVDEERQELEVRRGLPPWTGELYRDIGSAFSRYSLS